MSRGAPPEPLSPRWQRVIAACRYEGDPVLRRWLVDHAMYQLAEARKPGQESTK